jgi:hypothetical protein
LGFHEWENAGKVDLERVLLDPVAQQLRVIEVRELGQQHRCGAYPGIPDRRVEFC